jgi:hypothetical protein
MKKSGDINLTKMFFLKAKPGLIVSFGVAIAVYIFFKAEM